MIPSTDYTDQVRIYSFKGEGRWRIVSYCEAPSLTMEEISTGKREDFGLGGLTSAAFELIKGLEWDHQHSKLVRLQEPTSPDPTYRIRPSLAGEKERDCPICNSKKSMGRHNADWNCYKCGHNEIDNQGYDLPPAPSPWIAIKKTPPTHKDGDESGHVFFIGTTRQPFREHWATWDVEQDNGATHWMPIPPLPKEKEVDPFKELWQREFNKLGPRAFTVCTEEGGRKIWDAACEYQKDQSRSPKSD